MSSSLAGALVAVGRMPSELARQDLTPRGTAVVSAVALALVTGLDLIDGVLGAPFAVGFILISATAPLSVQPRGLYWTGVQPVLLMVAVLLVVAAVTPQAIAVDNLPESANTLGRTLAATLQRGEVLLVGQGFAIVTLLLRMWSLNAPHAIDR